jgi:hypothetical protein
MKIALIQPVFWCSPSNASINSLINHEFLIRESIPGLNAKGQGVASVTPGLVQGKGLVLEIHSRS